MPCDCQAEVLARLERMEAKLDRLLPPPKPEPDREPVPPLVRALGDVFGHSCFMARDAWQRAIDGAAYASARGEPEPALWAALNDLGIDGAQSLGFQLGKYDAEGLGIRRGGPQHKTNTWEVLAWARRS